MREWEELVSAALLGTVRRELNGAVLPDAVRRFAGSGDPERSLLAAAAALSAYRKAGRLPVREVTRLSVAPQDDRALVGPRAQRRLALLLAGEHLHLLREWLDAVAARGMRVPAERLPMLAEVARTRPELRAPVAAAAGPRGAWLAALRPEWTFLADQAAGDPDVWRYGTEGQRHAWLAALRDVAPSAALAALGEVWPSEPAPVRVRFLEVLRDQLSMMDEKFLEQALDDRARDVRRLAAELLAALPDSALAQRMADRLRPLLAVGSGTLRLHLPASCDEAMRRDGVTEAAPSGVGVRAWWLGQLVSAAPLAVWDELGGAEELVRIPVEGCDPRLLTLGWAAAAVRERSAEWARALLHGEIALPVEQIARLVAVLPAGEQAPVLASLPLIPALYQALPAPWPAGVGTRVLDRIAGHREERAVAHVADIAARAVPPDCLDHPITHQPPDYDASPWRRRLIDTLVFRRAMYEEL